MDMKLGFFTKDDSFPFYIQYGGHKDDMYIHSHADFYELVIVLEGSAQHLVDDESFIIKKGDVFVVGRDLQHGYKHTKNFRICNIMFRPDKLLSADYDIKKSAGFHSLFLLSPRISTNQSFQNRLSLNSEAFFKLSELIDLAISEYNSEKPGKQTVLLSYFMLIVAELSRLYASTAVPENYREIDGIAAAAAFMENNFMADIKTEQLLEISHYSQRHFIRLFSSVYSTTPQKYLLNIRVRNACSLLANTDLSVTEVAIRSGFNDSNYFSRVFKSEIGVPPNRFRTRLARQ